MLFISDVDRIKFGPGAVHLLEENSSEQVVYDAMKAGWGSRLITTFSSSPSTVHSGWAVAVKFWTWEALQIPERDHLAVENLSNTV